MFDHPRGGVAPGMREELLLNDSETQAFENGEEGVEGEIIWGGEKERMIPTRGLDNGLRWR